jgi:SAM-dependent methyltransferase
VPRRSLAERDLIRRVAGVIGGIAGIVAGRRDRWSGFDESFRRFADDATGWTMMRQPMFESAAHPESYIDFECRFAARHLRTAGAERLLDIGSYRGFVIGLTAGYRVTSLDVRTRREPEHGEETIITGDARRIPAGDATFDAVVTLSTVEHLGLGRYGDDLDPAADAAGTAEMIRVLRPGGVLILTTTVTAGPRTVAFNAHRIYRPEDVHALAPGLERIDERFFSHTHGPCGAGALSVAPGAWDVICCCWRKPTATPPHGP